MEGASLLIRGCVLDVQAISATTGPAGHTVDSREGREVGKAELVRESFLEVVASWLRIGRIYKWRQKRIFSLACGRSPDTRMSE